MEDNVHMLTLQTQLNSFMDSTLKRVVDEITLLVKHRMEPILDGATVNYAHTHTEHDDLQDLEIQLNCCIDTHLKHVTAEILSYVKDSVAQFVRERADKDSEMKRLEEERLRGHGRDIGWGSTDQGTVFLHPATDPLSDLNTAAADDDPGLSEDAEEEAVEDQSGEVVAGMACFMVAQPVADYDLGVVTINLSDANQRHGADPLPDPHPCPEVWATEEVEASQQPTSQGSQEAADPREEDVELSDDLTGLGGDAVHRCSQCGKSFSKEWVLHRHLRRHSEGGSGVEGEGARAGHVCPHCGRGFRQRKGLTSHLLSHGGDRAYTCDVCGQRFKRRESLNKHRRQHTGVKPHGCPHCPRRFYRTDGLKSHLRVHQDHRKLLPGPSRPKHCICTHCGKTFASTAQLTVHERTHTGEQPYECPLCHKRFRYAGGLSGHKLTHQCERTYVCPHCSKGFRCAKHLKRHLVTHSDARPHACSLCVMAFRTANELKAHVLRHGLERTHACPDCGKSFKTDYEVKLHRRTHNGERPYPCDLCPQAFRRPHHLASHRLIHTGERPHACDLCERRFYRSTELQSHKRKVHLREQAHTCDPCQKVFTSLALLEAHRRTSHLAALELPAQAELLAQGLHRYPKILPRCEGEQAASTTSPRPEAAPSLSVPGQVLYQGGPSGGSRGIVFVLTQQPGTLPAPSPAAVLSPIAMATANPTPTTPVHFTVLLPATPNTPATVTLATPQVSNPGTRGRSVRSARNRTSVKQAKTQSDTTAQVSTDGSTQDEDGREKRGKGRGAVGRRGGVGKRGRRATGRGSVTAVSPHTDGPGPAEQPP